MNINGAEFKKWITARPRRNPVVQDLADDIRSDGRWPAEERTVDGFRSYLVFRGACSEALEAFATAARAFKAWKARHR